MVVVDPGVGHGAAADSGLERDGYHFVAPDNGVLSMVYAKEERIHVRHITLGTLFPAADQQHVSSRARHIRSGRGIFSQAGRLPQIRRRD